MIPVLMITEETKLSEISEPVSYLVARNGLHLFKRNTIYEACVKVPGVSHLAECAEGFSLNVALLPREILDKATAFCAAVYEEIGSEAVALLYVNLTSGEWQWEVPEQVVPERGMSVRYEISSPPDDGILFGSIHSHCAASAFQSGTDEKDETGFDGIHITVGHLPDAPTYDARLVLAGKTFKVDLGRVVAAPTEVEFDRSLIARVKVEKSKPSWGLDRDGDDFEADQRMLWEREEELRELGCPVD